MNTEKQWLVIYKVWYNQIETINKTLFFVDVNCNSRIPDWFETALALDLAPEMVAKVEIGQAFKILDVIHTNSLEI